MKRALFSRRWLIAALLILSLVLVACERPLLPDEPQDEGGNNQPEEAPTQPVIIDQPDQPEVVDEPDQPEVVDEPDQPEVVDEPDQPEETAEETTEVTYIVKAGDTLFKIGQRYNVPVDDIAAANNLSNVDTLVPGQVLIIPVSGEVVDDDGAETPGERVHIVQAGENLFRIGLRYGFTVAELAAYNNIPNPNRIEVGQQILIPPGGNP